MNIELVQLAGRDGDTAYNLDRVLEAIATCAGDTDLLVFPETCLTGFLSAVQLAECAETLDGPSACLLYTSPSPRDQRGSRMPSSA